MNFLYNNEAYQANIPKYKHWLGRNKRIYLSSAFYRDHRSDEKILSFLNEKVLSSLRDEKTPYYNRYDLYKNCYISWDDREDIICSYEIDENEIKKLI